jgi:hypothetical protein
MAIRTADAEWRGNLAKGSGHMRRSPISEAQMALLDREGSGAAIEVPGEAVVLRSRGNPSGADHHNFHVKG